MSTTPDSKDTLRRIVAEGKGPRRRFGWKRVVAVALIVAAGLAYLAARAKPAGNAPTFRTEALKPGTLRVRVQATGNLQPTNEVDVGSEVSGLVETVFVDDNDRVKKGQVLAQLDISKLQDQVVNARAAMASAEARVLQAVASVTEARANLTRLRQVAELSGGKVPSKAELEAAEASAARAVADEASARAAVEQAKASLSSSEINLRKATIRSPIDGVVLSRQIEPGQTVAASFQAPTLFTLAEDLTSMQLEVDVDEADVGQVREGQPASFTVDAYPKRQYPATITRVGYGAQTTNNVVTYTAVLTVTNDDLTLRPGMTATADIITVERPNVLLVPNAALRFTPPSAPTAPAQNRSLVSSLMPRPPGPPQRKAVEAGPADGASARIWVLKDGQLMPIQVTVGQTDKRQTEVSGPDLKPGLAVVVETLGA